MEVDQGQGRFSFSADCFLLSVGFCCRHDTNSYKYFRNTVSANHIKIWCVFIIRLRNFVILSFICSENTTKFFPIHESSLTLTLFLRLMTWIYDYSAFIIYKFLNVWYLEAGWLWEEMWSVCQVILLVSWEPLEDWK